MWSAKIWRLSYTLKQSNRLAYKLLALKRSFAFLRSRIKPNFHLIIGQLEDDLTVIANETTFLKGEKRMVSNFQIQSTGDDSYFVSGIWCTSATPYGTFRPSAFWMHWNDGQIEDFNDILILNIKTGSALFTKEEKEDFTKDASKNGNDGDWTISIVSHDAGGSCSAFLAER